jgi:hypothetical protein
MIISWKTKFALIAARNFRREKDGLMWKEMLIEEF